MVDCYYHDNYIHDINNPADRGRSEAFYLGSTSTTSYTASHRFKNCRIENNVISNVWGDGIQVANGTFIIKNNIIKRFGLAQLADQRNGILIGGNATATVLRNVIDGGRGNALMVFGVGRNIIKHNTIKNIDISNLTSMDIVYINARVSSGAPLLSLEFSHNYIHGKTNRFGVVNMTSLSSSSGGAFSYNTVAGTNLKPYAISSKDKWIQ
jgi:parallel beta-helix repeat protein